MTLSKMALVAREQLNRDVKTYAETLKDVVNGSEWFCKQYVDYDNGETSEDYPDAYTRLAKYFGDGEPMDLQFIVDARGEYLGAKFALALGAPTIYFDTREGWVRGYWGADYAEAPVSDWTRTDIDEYFRDQWDCVRGG